MKRSEAAKYARLSAAAALVLAILTAGVYLERKWVAHRESKKAPPPAPRDVSRLSSGLTFSKVEGNRAIFTVAASKSTDYKDKAASLLEDVGITIFGRTGDRHDTIRTQSCQYEKEGGGVTCSGEVQIDLQSAADAERAAKNPSGPAAQKVHAETRGIIFNRFTGLAETDQPVKFNFPSGSGDAVGVEYHSQEGALRLLRDVRLLIVPQANGASAKKPQALAASDPVHVTGRSLEFGRNSRYLHLLGPVEAQTRTAHLLAGELTLLLDAAFHAEKLIATPGGTGKNPQLSSLSTDGPSNVSAETLTAYFAPEGWLTKFEGAGNMQGSRLGGKEQQEFSAENGVMDLRPRVNQPEKLSLNGNVLLKTRTEGTGNARTLQTTALLVEFAENGSGGGSIPKRAETLAAGTIEWTDSAPQTGTTGTTPSNVAARAKLDADKLEMEFGSDGKARQLLANGNVRTERASAGKPLQTATSHSGVAQLLPNGSWSQMDLQGDVKLKQGDQSGQGDHAMFVQATQTATLTGKALARDATTETHAPRIIFNQPTGDIHAEGGVRSTDFSAKTSATQLAPVPANITSESMQGNAKSGRAFYAGHARLWQGDSVMEADSIELLRDAKVLNAAGNVRAVFPQAPGTMSVSAATQPVAGQQARPKKPELWHVSSGTLTYHDAEGLAHLEKNVVAQSAEQTMRAPLVDLYFTKSVTTSTSAPNTPAPPKQASGAQQISRAVGTGGVIVEQGSKRATAERGEYLATEGKFVMSGGDPTIFDASEGTTRGHQLTFFLADDTIIVDSENGARTLTKHRVDK
jgi:lipopolysaccharide export system protein LptA